MKHSLLFDIPQDIYYLFFDYLFLPDIIIFQRTCKIAYNSTVKDNHLWKKKCNTDYPSIINKINIPYFRLYKNLFLTRCFFCFKFTQRWHPFFKLKLCISCCNDSPGYCVISKKEAIRNHFIKKEQLYELDFVKIKNFTFFLLKDVVRLSLKIHKSINVIFELKQNQLKRKMSIALNRYSNFTKLFNILYLYCNINLNSIVIYINRYSKGDYAKFLKSKKYKIEEIIKSCIELDFILNNETSMIINTTKNTFRDYLENKLLSSLETFRESHPYILNTIEDIKKSKTEKFNRKEMLIKMNRGEFIKNYNIQEFIKTGNGNLEKIVLNCRISHWIEENVGYQEIIWRAFELGFSVDKTLKLELETYDKEIIPDFILEFYDL